jgi:hypothetical protein
MGASNQTLPQDQVSLFGGNGVVVETGTTAITGDFCAVQILEEANFSLFTEKLAKGPGDAMTGFAIPAGTILFNGLGITAFTLTSGKVRAYNR